MLASDPYALHVLKRIRGRRLGAAATSEAEHFYRCPGCSQAVDMRSLYQVFHHEAPDHQPLSEAELIETSTIEGR
jgi:hypothetical protein